MEFNGVEVPDFDHAISDHPHKDRYEDGLIESIRETVSSGDSVVNIGAGIGVSSVVASREGGEVVCYEPSSEFVRLCRKTVRRNQADVSVIHKSVSEPIHVLGEDDGEMLPPEDLPDCDVLVMDCEGSERKILSSMEINPHSVIVETHGHLGSPRQVVRRLLDNRGYSVVNSRIAEIGELEEMCLNKDVYVLTGESKPGLSN